MGAAAATVAMCGLVTLSTLAVAHVYDHLFTRQHLLVQAWPAEPFEARAEGAGSTASDAVGAGV